MEEKEKDHTNEKGSTMKVGEERRGEVREAARDHVRVPAHYVSGVHISYNINVYYIIT